MSWLKDPYSKHKTRVNLTHTAHQRGDIAEAFTARFLKRQGYSIVCHNYRCRYGEIDIIAQQAQWLVFIEVRFRTHLRWGGAQASIDQRKQQRIIKTAQHFLASHHYFGHYCTRFDFIYYQNLIDQAHMNWIQNAFIH